MDAQFIIVNESTIKYTNQTGQTIFTFPNEEESWTFVFNLAGYDQKIQSFDTNSSWQNVQLTESTTSDTSLFIHVKNESNNESLSSAYVNVGGVQNGYTNPYGWIKFYGDNIESSQIITVTKNGYDTELETIYVTPDVINNETIFINPQSTLILINISVVYNSSGILVPIDNINVLLQSDADSHLDITTSTGWVDFEGIASGTYTLYLTDLLVDRTFASQEHEVEIAPASENHLEYIMVDNKYPIISDWRTSPATINGTVSINSFSVVKTYLNITDENVNTTRCVLYPFYDTQPNYTIVSEYDVTNGLLCEAIYSTDNVNHTVRAYAVDYETYVRNLWVDSMNYITYQVNVGDVGDDSILFEEHFDYSTDITLNGWNIIRDYPLTPENNKLVLTGGNPVKWVYHELNNDIGENFYCEWNQKTQLGNSNFVLFNSDELLSTPINDDTSFASHVTTHIYWYPPLDSVADEDDYTVDSYGEDSYMNLGGYSFPYLTPDDINKETSTMSFYPVATDLVLSTINVDNNRVLSNWDRSQEYLYTVFYNSSTKTYDIYQDGKTLITKFPVHNYVLHENPNAIGFYLAETTDLFQLEIDNIKCVYGFPTYIVEELAGHCWNSEGEFDKSCCTADENTTVCVIRTGFGWFMNGLKNLIFNNFIIFLIIVVLGLAILPIYFQYKKLNN